MRISDWSSDVCSSDLLCREVFLFRLQNGPAHGGGHFDQPCLGLAHLVEGSGEQLHDMEPVDRYRRIGEGLTDRGQEGRRSEEHTSELQLIMRIWYAVSCLKHKKRI